MFAFITPYTISAQNNPQTVDIKQLINSINDSLKKHYIFPEKAELISVYLVKQLNKKTYNDLLIHPQKLAKQIESDIQKVHTDPHLRVHFDPGFLSQKTSIPTAEQISKVSKFWKENNYMFKKLEVLPGNIGYLPFDGFIEEVEGAKPTIAAALKFLANTSALIIDLRQNRGGSPQMVSQMESYFFNKKTALNHIINRSNNDTTFFFADPSKTDSLYLSMPLYILTSNQTFSAAEDFTYGMQIAKRAIVVGETTGGGAHPQMPFAVSSGFVVSIPFARSFNPITKTDWEGTGVIPNVKATAGEAFTKAQELIFRNNLLNATDQKEKNRIHYYINSLLVNNENKQFPFNNLSSLAGTYGGLVIYLENNKLYCKNNYKDGSVTELKYLVNKLFVLDKDAQIEFINDSDGNYSGIKIFVEDGNVFESTKK